MGNRMIAIMALAFGRASVIAAEEYAEYYYSDDDPVYSRWAHDAIIEFHHQHFPVPLLPLFLSLEVRDGRVMRKRFGWSRWALCRFFRWRLERAKEVGIRGVNWWYTCPKCGHRLYYSPRTHPCRWCENARVKAILEAQEQMEAEKT